MASAGEDRERRRSAEVDDGVRPGVMQALSFNQDGTCVAVGTSTGYRVFACAPAFAGDAARAGAVHVEARHLQA